MPHTGFNLTADQSRALKEAAAAQRMPLKTLVARMVDHYIAEGPQRMKFIEADLQGHGPEALYKVDRASLQGLDPLEVAARMPAPLVRVLERAGIPRSIVAHWFRAKYTPELGAALIQKMNDAHWAITQRHKSIRPDPTEII